jgi:hypothetical protein
MDRSGPTTMNIKLFLQQGLFCFEPFGNVTETPEFRVVAEKLDFLLDYRFPCLCNFNVRWVATCDKIDLVSAPLLRKGTKLGSTSVAANSGDGCFGEVRIRHAFIIRELSMARK